MRGCSAKRIVNLAEVERRHKQTDCVAVIIQLPRPAKPKAGKPFVEMAHEAMRLSYRI
jgi:hypothetical protein